MDQHRKANPARLALAVLFTLSPLLDAARACALTLETPVVAPAAGPIVAPSGELALAALPTLAPIMPMGQLTGGIEAAAANVAAPNAGVAAQAAVAAAGKPPEVSADVAM